MYYTSLRFIILIAILATRINDGSRCAAAYATTIASVVVPGNGRIVWDAVLDETAALRLIESLHSTESEATNIAAALDVYHSELDSTVNAQLERAGREIQLLEERIEPALADDEALAKLAPIPQTAMLEMRQRRRNGESVLVNRREYHDGFEDIANDLTLRLWEVESSIRERFVAAVIAATTDCDAELAARIQARVVVEAVAGASRACPSHPPRLETPMFGFDFYATLEGAMGKDGALEYLGRDVLSLRPAPPSGTAQMIEPIQAVLWTCDARCAELSARWLHDRPRWSLRARRNLNAGSPSSVGREADAQTRAVVRCRWEAAQGIGEILRSQRGPQSGDAWLDEFAASICPIVFVADPIDSMLAEVRDRLHDDRAAKVDAILSEYRLNARSLRLRSCEALIDNASRSGVIGGAGRLLESNKAELDAHGALAVARVSELLTDEERSWLNDHHDDRQRRIRPTFIPTPRGP